MGKNTPKDGVEMAAGAVALRDECAVRFRDAVVEAVPAAARKRVAQLLGASPETVDGWLDRSDPKLPGTRHLLAAFAVFGPEFAARVLAPCGEWTRALSIEARSQRVRREIAEMRAELDALAASPMVGAEVRASLDASEAAVAKAEQK